MAFLEDVVIVSAARTPIGKFQGSLSDPQLGAIVVREAVKRAGIYPDTVDECIMGNVISAGLGQNPARQAALGGGLANSVSAVTINKVCGSGLKSVALGQQAIQTGNSHVVVAGGVESMTNAPYLLQTARKGFRLGDQKVVDSMVHDGLWDIFNDYHMGNTGENVAEKYKIAREEQDEYALNSHRSRVVQQGRVAARGLDHRDIAQSETSIPAEWTTPPRDREIRQVEAVLCQSACRPFRIRQAVCG